MSELKPDAVVHCAAWTAVDAAEDEENKEEDIPLDNVPADYVLNTSSLKFHLPTSYMVKRIDDKNKATYSGDMDYLIREGYEPCGHCDP